MANRKLKRYGLEGGAKVLIVIGLLLVLFSWIMAVYYFGTTGKTVTLFIVPVIFTLVLAILLLIIRYRYTLYEKYPYLMNLPSLFSHIDASKQSAAFSMIFTVHALVIAFLGLLSIALTIAISSSVRGGGVSPFLYLYLVIIGILGISVLLQYRRIYIRFSKRRG